MSELPALAVSSAATMLLLRAVIVRNNSVATAEVTAKAGNLYTALKKKIMCARLTQLICHVVHFTARYDGIVSQRVLTAS